MFNAAAPLDDYKAFIDGLVRISPCVLTRWINEKRSWPDLPENTAINRYLVKLSDADRELLARLLQSARDGGIHDTLAFLDDEITFQGFDLLLMAVNCPWSPSAPNSTTT